VVKIVINNIQITLVRQCHTHTHTVCWTLMNSVTYEDHATHYIKHNYQLTVAKPQPLRLLFTVSALTLESPAVIVFQLTAPFLNLLLQQHNQTNRYKQKCQHIHLNTYTVLCTSHTASANNQ